MSETILEQQNRIIISLLARRTPGIEYIERIVKGGKKKGRPEDFVRAYNALDGSKTVTEIAKIVGVSQPSMTVVLQTWEERGIVYKTGTSKSSRYVGLLKLPTKTEKHLSATKAKGKRGPKSEKPKTSPASESETSKSVLDAINEASAEASENEERSGS